MISGADPDAVSVVHNGVPAIQPVRDSIPSPGGRWILGMVALMRPRKGLEVALEAVARLRAGGHDVVLRCIGPFESCDYQAEIERRVDELNLASAVELQGFTSDVPSALGKVDALVLPSLYGEGLPMVVLEAMAAGLPVIATEVEGTPEAITHGVEGLLAKPRDPVSLAEAIEALVIGAYDWSRMSEAAIARHRSSFSDLAMAEKTAEVYRKVLRQRVVPS
jgi:glycosyltransferase involved in cell wall biosynthesis